MLQAPNLKKLRELRQWSQAEAGEEFGVDQSTWSRWEDQGMPDQPRLKFTRSAIQDALKEAMETAVPQ